MSDTEYPSDFVSAYVPDCEFLSPDEALKLAQKRDEIAAENLKQDAEKLMECVEC